MPADAIDVQRLGERLRRTRKKQGLTLQDVANETGVSVATVSRVERGGSKDIDSSTLVALSNWLGTPAEKFSEAAAPPPPPRKTQVRSEATPDVIELYLRADKNLDRDTAVALGKMFRAAYEHLSKAKNTK